MNRFPVTELLPPMKSGEELRCALEILPEYEPGICMQSVPVRLMALSDIYQIYVPSRMSMEIYSKCTCRYSVPYRKRGRSWRYSSGMKITG